MMTIAEKRLRIEREADVLRVTLARPERRNAFDAQLIEELAEAFASIDDARAVVLAGDGASFSAGADAEWMRSAGRLSYEENVSDALRFRRMLELIDSCPVPVIARVQGHALGGGAGLVACADTALASPDASFAFSEVRLGIVPAVISPFVVEKIGSSAARWLFTSGQRFSADTALRIGLVHEIAVDLDAAVERLVSEIRRGAPQAVRTAKRLSRSPLPAEVTAQLIAQHRTSEEGQEGLRAFLDKESPRWQ
jgi:methylglutaconyl-CoA hydratase